MRKTKAILLILSIITFILIITQITVNAESTYVADTYIDSPASSTVEGKMKVNGWYMTNDEKAEVKIYIDGQEVQKTLEKRESRPDVLQAITGFGTPEQNPEPGYCYIIEDEITVGEHDVEVRIYSRDGEILATHSQHFYYAGYKATTYLENPGKNGEIITANNKMWGWYMSNDEKAEIKILVDNVEQEVSIKRNIRIDVISAIKGYGTEQENPRPGYEFNLNVDNISDGEHTLIVQIISHKGELLSQDIRTIVVNKYIAKSYIDHPAGETVTGKIELNGWVMTTDEKATTKILIDGKETKKLSEIREDRQDVLNAITGYGDETVNPQPGIKYILDNTGIDVGKHTITLQVISREGKIIEEQKETFYYENYIAKMYLENPANDGNTINMDSKMWGWVMSNDKNAKVKVLIDDIEQETKVTRTARNDVISSITGYGDSKTNPTPGFEFKFNFENIKDGEHNLKVQTISEDGQVLAEDTRTIIVNKYVAKAYIDHPAKETLTQQIELSGWVMTTDTQAQIKIYIDGREANIISQTRENRQDVLNAITGYGDSTQNPQPGVKYVIDRTGINAGEHTITLKVISREGNVIEEQTENFKFYKTEMVVESPKTSQITGNQLTVGGWFLSEAENKKLVIKFDNDVIQNIEFKTRDDLTSLMPEYGGTELNLTPWFEANIDLTYYTGVKHQVTVQLCLETTGEVLKQQIIDVELMDKYFTREVITYGYSGAYLRGVNGGIPLVCYKYGEGPNVMFATFCLHGFEDSWRADGEVLVNAANQFYERLLADKDMDLAKKWTIYIFPEVNPDGRRLGYTNQGPGRTTLYSEVGQGIDINRSWQTGSSYVRYTDSRNYNGTQGFQAYEAKYLRDFLLQHKSQNGQTVLVDLHGWEDQLIGDEEICKYYKTQYPSCRTTGYGRYGTQYLITWARQNLGAKVSLVELPVAKDYSEVISMGLIEKYIEGTLQMLRGI